MPNHHPSRSWRGCAMCKPHKRRGAGRAVKDPVAVQRRLGNVRRYSRHSVDRARRDGDWGLPHFPSPNR